MPPVTTSPTVAEPLAARTIATPVGRVRVSASAAGIRSISFLGAAWDARPAPEERADAEQADTPAGDVAEPVGGGHIQLLAHELERYFAGELTAFTVPLDPRGTPFQLKAWKALQVIPYGQTRTYAQQAAAIEQPSAVRAVGKANGDNPIPIVIPCHRVIGANGSLVGYGGGIERKRALLELEQRASGQTLMPG